MDHLLGDRLSWGAARHCHGDLRRMDELTANFRTRTKRTSPRLLHPLQNPPHLVSQGQVKGIISQTKLKRFISEAYFKRTGKELETTLGLPAVSPKVLRPRRDLVGKQHRLTKVDSPAHRRRQMAYKEGFGYVTGLKKELIERTALEIRLPQSPRETGYEDDNLTSPISLKGLPTKSYESILSKASDSRDRINIEAALRYCIDLRNRKPIRRVIYQSLVGRGNS